jgi:phospho-N-acetylmuramoyl-pentapeptide-transferase
MISALFAGGITFLIAAGIGWPIVSYLKTQTPGKAISTDQPTAHKDKEGTPTFGGFIIWLPTFVVTAIAVDWITHRSILLPLGMIGATGAVGFLDDLGTLQRGGFTKGLSWRLKLSVLTVFSLIAAFILYYQLDVQSLNVPWLGQYELGPVYIVIAVITIVATTSAVAVTDGLDSLAGGTTLLAFVAYGVIAFIQGQEFVATFAFIIAGANLGFLWYNAYPAKIFMGETGALALGASLAVITLMTGHWLLLPLIGIVFVSEALSNLVQIGYYKLTKGKRLLKRAPLHHHFEELGWKESGIVTRFWVIGFAAAMVGIALAMAVPE